MASGSRSAVRVNDVEVISLQTRGFSFSPLANKGMNISELLRAETSPDEEAQGLAGKSSSPSLRVRLLIVAAALLPSSVAALLLLMPDFRSPAAIATALPVLSLSLLAVLTVIFIAQYRALLDRIQSQSYTLHQDKVITLLLEDFDAGSKDWLWEANRSGELVYLSGRLSELTGHAPEQLLGRRLQAISGYPAHIRPWQDVQGRIDAREEIREIEVPVKVNKQRRWWQLSARPVYSAAGDFLGYRGVGRDTTDAHRAKAALVLAKDSAERASDSKSQFLNVMSHELRTPLNAIIGFSEIMANEREGPLGVRTYADYARNIVESSRHLQRVINNILDASRIDTSTFKLQEQEIDAAELARVVVRNGRQLADEASIALISDYASVRAEIRGDLVRLRQILDNLLINAIKFTPAQGKVEFTVRDEVDGGLSFVIRDTGIGIAKKDLERVFEPFVQADVGMNRKFAGTGLGLPIARKLAEAHGGKVKLESTPNVGTTATFTLPSARVIREAGAAPIAEAVAAA
jgi:PAS domain S-box-containing protein